MVFEAGETLPMVASGSSFSVAFTPTVTGTTRLRIRLWGGVWVPDSCGTFSTGEVEDYATTITGASSQGPGTGTGGSGGSSSGCFGSVTNIPMKALDWGLLTLISLLLLFGVRRRI